MQYHFNAALAQMFELFPAVSLDELDLLRGGHRFEC